MEDNNDLVGFIFAIAVGAFAILASIFNWDFFFNSRKAKFMVNVLTRNGARIFYGIVGLALFFLAYKIMTT